MRRKTYTVFAPMERIIIDRPIRKVPTAPPPAKPCEPKLNRYTCAACKYQIVTVESVVGTTPASLDCRNPSGCKGRMWSAFYRGVSGAPTFEWRQATVSEYRRMSPDGRDYVDMGGLDIYPIATEQKAS